MNSFLLTNFFTDRKWFWTPSWYTNFWFFTNFSPIVKKLASIPFHDFFSWDHTMLWNCFVSILKNSSHSADFFEFEVWDWEDAAVECLLAGPETQQWRQQRGSNFKSILEKTHRKNRTASVLTKKRRRFLLYLKRETQLKTKKMNWKMNFWKLLPDYR